MGLSASKRVVRHLQASPQFSSDCSSVYADCLSLSQHAFAGIKPYQLYSAVEQLHRVLYRSLPLISKWVPHTPGRDRVDRAFRSVIRSRGAGSTAVQEEDTVLDEAEFEELASEVFAECIASNMEREALKKVAVGAVGIGGVGAVVKPGNGVLVAAIAAFALGVGIDLYVRFDG
ncbi:hypothetical protein F511_31500 [Dorcoceras hygrometricum]|uniref:Uncharacterized protein n=1 Tax=Dorcoceras hygrometricum TaxID=472368 RepID=A0A2Z7D734_9LAMI|nr:hypothetical protein F511_31500 [Dorcoceras hygrometricum]